MMTALTTRQLGRGEIELAHQAFHTLQPGRAAAHLRDLLMVCGVLPRVDKRSTVVPQMRQQMRVVAPANESGVFVVHDQGRWAP
jgi:hypothetical protein